MFGIVLHFAILWFLITLFTRQTNADQSLREAKIVYIGMGFVWLCTQFLFGAFLGFRSIVIEAFALYMLVDKVCEPPQKVTIKICVWYIVLSSMVSGLNFFLESLWEAG